ncbi:hypothetical protein TELCIR_23052, partial [Teladorsagia circumcincta]
MTSDLYVSPFRRHSSQRTAGQDIMQSEKVVFTPTSAPSVKGVTVAGKLFVMNPEKWTLGVNTKLRLFGFPNFQDYIVVLPTEYYLGTILKERAAPPYEANNAHNLTCADLMYPPMAIAASRHHELLTHPKKCRLTAQHLER